MTFESLRSGYQALVFGASGGIGRALCEALAADTRCAGVCAVSRQSDPRFDLENPQACSEIIGEILAQGPFDLLLDATGWLHDDAFKPEKRLAAVQPEAIEKAMRINAIGPFMLLQALVPHLPKDRRVIYAKWSARVGSIEDNRKGGWYSYRASKASLNQLLQTAAIDLARSHPMCAVVAVQPGTVASELSKPFVAPTGAFSAADSVARVIAVLDAAQPTGRAQFLDHAGQPIPW